MKTIYLVKHTVKCYKFDGETKEEFYPFENLFDESLKLVHANETLITFESEKSAVDYLVMCFKDVEEHSKKLYNANQHDELEITDKTLTPLPSFKVLFDQLESKNELVITTCKIQDLLLHEADEPLVASIENVF